MHDKLNATGKRPSSAVIRKFALETYRNAGHHNFKVPKCFNVSELILFIQHCRSISRFIVLFQASVGWFRRWKKRYDIENSTSSKPTRPKVLEKQEVDPPVEEVTSNVSSSVTTGVPATHTLEEISMSTHLENFSLENIDWPPDLLAFSEYGGDGSKNTNNDADTACLNSLVNELMHDFSRYFVDTDPPPTTKPTKKYFKYDNDFKNEVLRFLNNRRIVEAAKKYNVNANTISVWLKDDRFQKRLTEVSRHEE